MTRAQASQLLTILDFFGLPRSDAARLELERVLTDVMVTDEARHRIAPAELQRDGEAIDLDEPSPGGSPWFF